MTQKATYDCVRFDCDETCEVWPTRSPYEFEVVCPQHGNVALIAGAHSNPPPRFEHL